MRLTHLNNNNNNNNYVVLARELPKLLHDQERAPTPPRRHFSQQQCDTTYTTTSYDRTFIFSLGGQEIRIGVYHYYHCPSYFDSIRFDSVIITDENVSTCYLLPCGACAGRMFHHPQLLLGIPSEATSSTFSQSSDVITSDNIHCISVLVSATPKNSNDDDNTNPSLLPIL